MAGDFTEPRAGEVILRDVAEEDLLIFYAHQLEPEAVQMADFPSRDRATFLTHWHRILAEPTGPTKTILFNGQVAGNIVSFEQAGRTEVGYWLGKDYWGRGVATHALSAFLDHIPDRPLYAHVARHNIASLRVLQKCGFTISGETSDEFELTLEDAR